MHSKLTYLKNFAKVLIWPIILGLGQFLLIIIFTFFFNLKYINTLQEQFPKLSTSEINTKFQEILVTNKYVQELNGYLIENNIYILFILVLLLLPILVKKYKKQKIKEKEKIDSKGIIKILLVSIFLAVSLNLLLFLANSIFQFTNRYDSTVTHISTIITTGLLAPILEEFIFRGIVYNGLKKFNSKKSAIVLVTLIFALFHFELSQMIYALIVGLYLTIVYEKTNDIRISIMAHIAINIFTLLFMPFIISTNVFIQIVLIIILGLGFYQKISIKEN